MSTLEINYRGASLSVEMADNKASLSINGLERDNKALTDSTQTVRLSSSVQTDYEWHEFIEAVVVIGPERIGVRLYANNQLLSEQEIIRS